MLLIPIEEIAGLMIEWWIGAPIVEIGSIIWGIIDWAAIGAEIIGDEILSIIGEIGEMIGEPIENGEIPKPNDIFE